MQRCPACGTRLEYLHNSCPECLHSFEGESARRFPVTARDDDETAPLPFDADEPARTIARFSNAAEAGFFAHVLQATEDVPARIRSEDHFDAISGYWSTRYHLEVPRPVAESAARALQTLIARSEQEDFVDSMSRFDERPTGESSRSRAFAGIDDPAEPVPSDGIRWGPIVLTLAAGSLAFFGFRALQPALKPRAEAPAAGRQKDAWDRLSTPEKPWVQKLEGNRRRELRFQRERGRAVLREYEGRKKVSEHDIPLPVE